MKLSRRDLILSSLGLGVAFAAGTQFARADRAAPSTFGLAPLGGAVDQTATLQRALDAAAGSGKPLFLPPGIYSTRRLDLGSGAHLTGVPGKSILRYRGGEGLIGVDQADDIRLDGIVLDGGAMDMGTNGALFTATRVERLQLFDCRFLRSRSGSILISRSDNIIVADNVVDMAATGIAVIDGGEAGTPAIIKGNHLRNLFFRKVAPSSGNGMVIEADALVKSNIVENAQGFGILVGSSAAGISITNNLISGAHIGIGIPTAIAETAPISGNRIFAVKDGAIRAMNGPTPVGPDIADHAATS